MLAPMLLALPLLLGGCDQINSLLGKKENANPAAAMMNRVIRVTTVELKPNRVDIERELTGRTAREDIVSTIFSRFCVGK